MLGMNNVIHHDYPAKFDFTEGAKKYAETIRKQVKEYQASGAAVVLMKPTLTDETENSYFSPFHTREGLIVYGEALERMAAGEENVILEKGKAFVFTPPIPAVALPAKLGRIARVFMSVTPADGCPRIAIVDLARTKVIRMKDGKASGEIRTDETREEGPLVGTWQMEERGADLWFSGRMKAKTWPARLTGSSACWMNSGSMNGVMAIFDFRPADRFAENRFDHDVNMIDLSILEDPWSVLPLGWVNRRIQNCLLAGAERTEDGYAWRLGFRGHVVNYCRFDITKLDHFGVYFIFDDDEGGTMGRYPVFKQLYGEKDEFVVTPERRLNQLAVFDRKGDVPADANGETTTVGVFGW